MKVFSVIPPIKLSGILMLLSDVLVKAHWIRIAPFPAPDFNIFTDLSSKIQ